MSKIWPDSPDSTIDATRIYDSVGLTGALPSESDNPDSFISNGFGPLSFLPSVITVSTSSRSTLLPHSASNARFASLILLSTLVLEFMRYNVTTVLTFLNMTILIRLLPS